MKLKIKSFLLTAVVAACASSLAIGAPVTNDGKDLQGQVSRLSQNISQLQYKMQQSGIGIKSKVFGAAVTTAPSSEKSIFSTGPINKDLSLLNQKATEELLLGSAGIAFQKFPSVVFGGELSGSGKTGFTNLDNTTADFSGAEMGFIVKLNPMVNCFTSITYDPEKSHNMLFGQAFVTVGNLNHFPLYGSAGNFAVPFGTSSTEMISSHIAKAFTLHGKVALVGAQHTFSLPYAMSLKAYGSTFAYKVEKLASSNFTGSDFGSLAGVVLNKDLLKASLELSYVSNMAGSDAYGKVAALGNFHHGMSANSKVTYGPVNLSGVITSHLFATPEAITGYSVTGTGSTAVKKAISGTPGAYGFELGFNPHKVFSFLPESTIGAVFDKSYSCQSFTSIPSMQAGALIKSAVGENANFVLEYAYVTPNVSLITGVTTTVSSHTLSGKFTVTF